MPGYNIYAPWDVQTNGFGTYRQPDTADLNRWSEIVTLFLNQDYETAQSRINSYAIPYNVVKFNDTDTQRTYYVLREVIDSNFTDENNPDTNSDDEHGSFNFGWGLYVFSPSGVYPIIVNAVHPCDDFIAPAMSLRAFQKWNAPFFMVAGAGREVLWAGGEYNNSLSLSDPSRVTNHPFNTAYRQFAQFVRSHFSRRELSVQIHSYDWNKYLSSGDCQLSAGSSYPYPGLPIRDLSNEHFDVINNTEFLTVPEYSIGTNNAVYVDQYYSVYAGDGSTVYYQNDTPVPISNVIALPGYGSNVQMLYTCNGWNKYDSFSPFFHIELDELPSGYHNTVEDYYAFYGYNATTGDWDAATLFNNTLAYYTPWLDAMDLTFPELFTVTHLQPPTLPLDFRLVNIVNGIVNLQWAKSSDFFFNSYSLEIATDSLMNNVFRILDRTTNTNMAYQKLASIPVLNLPSNNNYYFRLRASDKFNNNCAYTDVIHANLPPLGNNEPMAPQRVTIDYFDNMLIINWDPVTLDIFNNPVNVSYYKVLRSPDPEYHINTWETIDIVTEPNYIIDLSHVFSNVGFYKIMAVVE